LQRNYGDYSEQHSYANNALLISIAVAYLRGVQSVPTF